MAKRFRPGLQDVAAALEVASDPQVGSSNIFSRRKVRNTVALKTDMQEDIV